MQNNHNTHESNEKSNVTNFTRKMAMNIISRFGDAFSMTGYTFSSVGIQHYFIIFHICVYFNILFCIGTSFSVISNVDLYGYMPTQWYRRFFFISISWDKKNVSPTNLLYWMIREILISAHPNDHWPFFLLGL